jgi:hypothetical protein
LSAEAESAAIDAMGAKAYGYYRRTGAGQWISEMR